MGGDHQHRRAVVRRVGPGQPRRGGGAGRALPRVLVLGRTAHSGAGRALAGPGGGPTAGGGGYEPGRHSTNVAVWRHTRPSTKTSVPTAVTSRPARCSSAWYRITLSTIWMLSIAWMSGF